MTRRKSAGCTQGSAPQPVKRCGGLWQRQRGTGATLRRREHKKGPKYGPFVFLRASTPLPLPTGKAARLRERAFYRDALRLCTPIRVLQIYVDIGV